jgi:hypothetical protein
MSKKCKHNRQPYYCKECGGKGICEHNKRRKNCKECKGKSICEHNKHKEYCKDCDGSQICEHDNRKYDCKECKGIGICEHNNIKRQCIKCGGSRICEHDKQKSQCKECDGSNICIHKKEKFRCKECKGNGICEHNKRKDYCIICTPETKYFCKSCRLFAVTKKNNYLCSYCNPDKPSRQKTKELKVKTFLEENNYKFIHNKKCNLDNSCQTYFPDFLIDCNTFFLIIECDEDAHSSYPIDCEKIRENNICFALGLPCVFIRFNPDKKGIKMKTKQKVLKSYIDYYISKENSDNEVCYLFY